MIEFALLSSGSKANSFYVSDGATRVLVDCGLTAREAGKRLLEHGVAPDSIDAIVITHEHMDHCAGVEAFAKRHSASLFANAATFAALDRRELSRAVKRQHFFTGEPFAIGDLVFDPFSVMHDADDPVAFRISSGGSVIAVVTDLGHVTNLVIEKTRLLDALILESNHDLDLLWEAPYPWALKKRISGNTGHISNKTAADLVGDLSEEDGCRLKVLIGAHISENSNHPELVHEALSSAWRSSTVSPPRLALGGVRHSTPLFRVGAEGGEHTPSKQGESELELLPEAAEERESSWF